MLIDHLQLSANQCVLYTKRVVFLLASSNFLLTNLYFRSLRYEVAGESFPFVDASSEGTNVWMRNVAFQGNARSNSSNSYGVVTKGLVVHNGAKIFCGGAASSFLGLHACIYVCTEACCASGCRSCSLNGILLPALCLARVSS